MSRIANAATGIASKLRISCYLPPPEDWAKTFKVEAVFGSWSKLQKEHFADGGIYDQISTKSQ
ncbi:MAG: hypothetical protein WC807_21915 [Hyphomicrobium sp.]